MSATRVSEYDRFGPWIDEVLDHEDVPRLFRDHELDLDAARLVLKVPRDIARRDATPDMDLYDYLLILDSYSLTVLQRYGAGTSGRDRARTPRGYDVLTVPYDQVVAIRDVVNLLDARLTIHASTGAAVTVRYNGAARANVTRLVDELRAATTVDPPGMGGRALLAAAGTAGGLTRLEPGKADQVFVSAFDKLSRSIPGVIAWTCHGRRSLAPHSGGLRGVVRRSSHVVAPMTLHGGVLASDGRALEVLGRDRWLVRGRTPVYSSSRLVMPLGSLERLTVAGHPTYDDATVVTLIAGQTELAVVVPVGSDAARVLADAAVG